MNYTRQNPKQNLIFCSTFFMLNDNLFGSYIYLVFSKSHKQKHLRNIKDKHQIRWNHGIWVVVRYVLLTLNLLFISILKLFKYLLIRINSQCYRIIISIDNCQQSEIPGESLTKLKWSVYDIQQWPRYQVAANNQDSFTVLNHPRVRWI